MVFFILEFLLPRWWDQADLRADHRRDGAACLRPHGRQPCQRGGGEQQFKAHFVYLSKVADEKFCETTIGSKDAEAGADLKLLFQTENFR